MADKIGKTNTGLSKSSKRRKLIAGVLTDMDAMQFSIGSINKDIPEVNNQLNHANHTNDSLSLVDNVGLLSKKVASQIPPALNIVLDNNNNNINSELNKHDTFTSSDTNNTEFNFDIYNLNSENLSISDSIAKWAVECNIPNTSTTKLL